MAIEGTPADILRLLKDRPQQAQELAATLGIDTSAVRRHLENLRRAGAVDAEDHIEGPGRPKKVYRVTAEGHESFQRDYALLLGLVLRKLRSARGERETETLLRHIAKDVAAPIAALPADARIDALVALYNRMGFEASFERKPGGGILTQRNCIILKTARDDPQLLCRCFDEGIVRAALPGATIEFQGSLATGAPRCTHAIRLGTSARRG